jgi:transcriptional regulator with XRE-family HTH domain
MESSLLDIRISQNIRKIRDLKGFSQEFIASQLSISQPAYCKIEQGKTQLSGDLLEKLARIMDVEEKWFEEFSDSIVFNNCSNSGNYNHYTINESIEKIEALYRNLCDEKDKRIQQLEKLLNL